MFLMFSILMSLLMIKVGLMISVKYPKCSDVIGVAGVALFLILTIGSLAKFLG